MKPKIISQPLGPLLSIETCRNHLGIVPIDGTSDGETHPDDAMILAFLGAAVVHAENFLGMSIAIRTLEIALDSFPDDEIELPMSPIIAVESITYTALDSDSEPEDIVLASDQYVLDSYQNPSWILPARNTSWPATADVINSVKVRYTAGYSGDGNPDTDAEPLPENIRAAILLYMGHLYENREDSSEKALSSIPNGCEALLRPERVRLGMA